MRTFSAPEVFWYLIVVPLGVDTSTCQFDIDIRLLLVTVRVAVNFPDEGAGRLRVAVRPPEDTAWDVDRT
jgi:hypothetical protein